MNLSAETQFARQVTDRPLPSPVLSIAVSWVCLALSLLIGETVISASPRMALFYSSFIVLASLVVLVCMVMFQTGQTSKHIGYLIFLLGVFYWFTSPAMGFALSSDGYVGDRYGIRASRESVIKSCTYLALFLTAAVTTYWLMFPRISTRINARSFATTPRGLPFAIFGLFFLGIVPYLVFSDGIQHIVTSLLAGRTEVRPWKSEGPLGNFRSAVYYFCISGFVAAGGFAGTWGTMMEKNRGLRNSYLAIFGFTTLIMYLDGGTRSWVALAVIPTVLAWVARTLKKRRVTIGRILFLVVLVCAVQLSFEVARASRHRGWSTENARRVDLRNRHFDNDFFTDLAVSIELVPSQHPYFYADDFFAFITHPIPRFLWENKPISGILIFYNDRVHKGLLGQSGTGNKLPSHIGQFYMSLGTFGVILLGTLAGSISAFASGMIRSNHMGICHLGSLVAVWWFLMSRGVYPGWVYPVLFTSVILVVGFRQTSRHLPSRSFDL